MGDRSNIEWTDATWNPVIGCTRVSAGCQNCYAERVAHRGMAPQHRGLTVAGPKGPRWNGEVRFVTSALPKPLRWTKPRRVFVNSLSDLFHEALSEEQIAAVFGVMAASPQHRFQVLTKRPGRMAAWFKSMRHDVPGAVTNAAVRACGLAAARAMPDMVDRFRPVLAGEPGWPLPNVWLGVSVEDQATADERIPLLLDTPAALRWVSYEPALGPVDFSVAGLPVFCCSGTGCGCRGLPVHGPPPYLDWIVVGGESGPGARPFNVEWARSVIRQGRDAGVPVFVKQLGALPFEGDEAMHFGLDLRDRKGGDWSEWPEGLRVREMPEQR